MNTRNLIKDFAVIFLLSLLIIGGCGREEDTYYQTNDADQEIDWEQQERELEKQWEREFEAEMQDWEQQFEDKMKQWKREQEMGGEIGGITDLPEDMLQQMYPGSEIIQGSGKIIREERDIREFTGVKLNSIGNLKIKFGDQDKLVIETHDNIVEHICASVEDGVLVIGPARNTTLIYNRKLPRFYLTVKKLNYLAASSIGGIEAPVLEADDLTVQASGSGDIIIEGVEAVNTLIEVSSNGNVEIGTFNSDSLSAILSSNGDLNNGKGEVKKQIVAVSSNGDYDGSSVESLKTKARLSSNGTASVWVTQGLEALLSSNGDLYYTGDPDEFFYEQTSGGDVFKVR